MDVDPAPDDTAQALARLLGDGAPPVSPPEALHAWVRGHVARLLDRSPDLLMHVLYRVDVAEADVKAAFETSPPGALPDALAALLVERVRRKIDIRRRYARNPAPPDATDDDAPSPSRPT